MEGFIGNGVNLQLIKKNAHHIIGGVLQFSGADPAEGTVIHFHTHGRPQLLIDGIEEDIFQADSQVGKGILIRRVSLQNFGCPVPDPGNIHQSGAKAETQGFPHMPGLDHAHSSVHDFLYYVLRIIS